MSKGKIALVTGANRGIGKEMVRQLAAKGFRVVLTARDLKAGAQAASTIAGDVGFLALDVADDQSISQAAENFSKESDQLDVLINNAGIYPDEGFNILTVSRELLVRTFQTNTFGAIRVIQAFLPFLNRADQARIVNLSSGYGELGGLSSDVPSYCLSKLTLNGATIMLDQALRNSGIAINSVCPGWSEPIWAALTPPRPSKRARTPPSGWQPMHIIRCPESFSGDAVKFLGEFRRGSG
jgi:NAD(P)-dependent dehydrogenase (short-subunit alcohol dehydrogenase family)